MIVYNCVINKILSLNIFRLSTISIESQQLNVFIRRALNLCCFIGHGSRVVFRYFINRINCLS